jgi:hypothetical protein
VEKCKLKTPLKVKLERHKNIKGKVIPVTGRGGP